MITPLQPCESLLRTIVYRSSDRCEAPLCKEHLYPKYAVLQKLLLRNIHAVSNEALHSRISPSMLTLCSSKQPVHASNISSFVYWQRP